jgi:Protein of unknown function (DUF2889)
MQRELLHTRSIELQGFLRSDGLYELEARLTDRRTYDSRRFPDSTLPAGEPLHDMSVRMSFDEDLLIHDFDADMPGTPYDGCRDAAPNVGSLAGLTIKSGFLQEANRRVAGVKGCTHLREMLQQIATAAFQTVVGVRLQRQEDDLERPTAKPKLIDSCMGHRSDSEWTRVRWPEFYRPRTDPEGKNAPPGQSTLAP